jgi:L-threonylcarbamoyladenylate synthase
LESTIVAVEPTGLRLLRPGPITCEELEAVAPIFDAARSEKLEAPGQLKSHYAPRTPMILGTGTPGGAGVSPASSGILPEDRRQDANDDRRDARPTQNQNRGLLAWREVRAGFDVIEVLSESGDLREAASTLFAKLRRLDEAGLDLILAEAVPEHGLGIAIMDRLRKAAAHE